jgi:hypothetical protein
MSADGKQGRRFIPASISLDLKGGAFESEDPAFRPLQRDDKLHIQAEISSPSLFNPRPLGLSQYRYSLTEPNWDVLALDDHRYCPGYHYDWFFHDVYGQANAEKNRNAIVFSYLFGGVFLAVPLLAPVLLLQIFPNLRRQ